MEFEVRYATATVDDHARTLGEVKRIAALTGTCIVLFDAERMAGDEHAKAALVHAVRSFQRGDPIARTLEMEALLYAAGSRQTRVGRTFGLHLGENRCWVAVGPSDEQAWAMLADLVRFAPDPVGITPEHRRRLCESFGITPAELEVVGEHRLTELVLERVALLDAYR